MENLEQKQEKSVKKQVKRVGFLTEVDISVYSMTKKDALELLEREEITSSEQMLNKWCRDDKIDAVFIAKGAPAARGLRISKQSLEAFIQTKNGSVEDLVKELDNKNAEIERLKQQLKEARKEINELKEQGIKVEKKTLIKITDINLSVDNAELTFKYKRALHNALFGENGELIEVKKNTKGKGQTDVLDNLTEEEKEAIIKERERLLQNN